VTVVAVQAAEVVLQLRWVGPVVVAADDQRLPIAGGRGVRGGERPGAAPATAAPRRRSARAGWSAAQELPRMLRRRAPLPAPESRPRPTGPPGRRSSPPMSVRRRLVAARARRCGAATVRRRDRRRWCSDVRSCGRPLPAAGRCGRGDANRAADADGFIGAHRVGSMRITAASFASPLIAVRRTR